MHVNTNRLPLFHTSCIEIAISKVCNNTSGFIVNVHDYTTRNCVSYNKTVAPYNPRGCRDAQIGVLCTCREPSRTTWIIIFAKSPTSHSS